MLVRVFTALILLGVFNFPGHTRGPAVEDFVGIEMDHPEGTPQGTEALFNFEEEMSHFEKNKGKPLKAKSHGYNQNSSNGQSVSFSIFTIFFVTSLPLLIWFLLMKNLRSKAAVETASNIEVLEKYRKQKELEKKDQQGIKNAS